MRTSGSVTGVPASSAFPSEQRACYAPVTAALRRPGRNEYRIQGLDWSRGEKRKSSPSCCFVYCNRVMSLVGLVFLKKGKRSGLLLKDDVFGVLRGMGLAP